jgi:hypothetical protein
MTAQISSVFRKKISERNLHFHCFLCKVTYDILIHGFPFPYRIAFQVPMPIKLHTSIRISGTVDNVKNMKDTRTNPKC